MRSKIDLVIIKTEKKSKEVNNLLNEVFAEVIFKLISRRQNLRSSKSSNPVTFSNHRVG